MVSKKVLIITPGYYPNTGGLETHLTDLASYLVSKNVAVYVLTYQPIVTKTRGEPYEKSKNLEIRRIDWFGKGWFLKLVEKPFMELIYLFPPLFIYSFFLLLKRVDIKTIHAQGLVAGLAGVLLGSVFRKRVIISIHAIYHFPKSGLYRKFSKFILGRAYKVLTLSQQSRQELINLGLESPKVEIFTYWIDQTVFKKKNKTKAKKELGWENRFVALFVGRLVLVKGVLEFLKAAEMASENIYWVIVGDGPLEGVVRDKCKNNKHIIYLGRIDNKRLPLVYNSSDVLVVPSIHEEGFGRVLLEALACGLPVVAANRGGIPEAVNDTVGKLIDISPENIKRSVEDFYENRKMLKRKSDTAIIYAKSKFTNANAEVIIREYE